MRNSIEHRPIDQLIAIVKNDFTRYNNQRLIDDGRIIKTVMYCNEKLGIPIREVKQVAIPVKNYRADLPVDFDKLYYVCALRATNSGVSYTRDPFSNNFDQDIIYEANLDRASLGNVENYQVTIKREANVEVHNYGTWVKLDVSNNSFNKCHIDCPNKSRKGKYTVDIYDDYIETPFKEGMLYLVYLGLMVDDEGNILFPFHPMITPYYEWSIKEKILQDIMFNTDTQGVGDMLKYAQQERVKAWLEAYNFTYERDYGQFLEAQKQKELSWYNHWFRYFQVI
jgi:hypothetical protein